MSTFENLAVLSSLIMVALELVMRALQRERDQSWFLALLGSWSGGVLLLLLIPYTTLSLAPSTIILLAVAGTSWAISVLAEFKSHTSLPVGLGALVASLHTVLLVIIGAIFFGEPFTLPDILGTALTVAGVLIACKGNSSESPGEPNQNATVSRKRIAPWLARGTWLRLLAVIAGAAAVVAEKVLIQRAPIELILAGGYVIPGTLYLILKPSNWRDQCILGSSQRTALIGLYTLLFTAVGPLIVLSFTMGSLGETFVILQSRFVLIVILGAIILRERTGLLRRGIGMVITALGLYLMIGVD
jgi:drug/metabolite transporter (DMT)-like permease